MEGVGRRKDYDMETSEEWAAFIERELVAAPREPMSRLVVDTVQAISREAAAKLADGMNEEQRSEIVGWAIAQFMTRATARCE